ncbi:MAG: Ig-like domain-containing protein [Dehalococcoidia bacterium]
MSIVYWAEVEQVFDTAAVYWAEVETSLIVGTEVAGLAAIPEITTVSLSAGGTVGAGETLDLTVTVLDENGDPVPNVSPTPTSSNTGIATVALLAATDSAGQATVRVTSVAAGSVTVTAALDGVSSAAQVTATAVVVSIVTTVTVRVPTISLEVGTTGSATVTVRDQNGDPMSGVAVTWGSTVDAVIADPASSTTGTLGTASVLLPALSAGTTTITATAGGVTSTGIVVAVVAVAEAPGYSTVGSAKVIVNCVSVVKRMSRAQPRRFSDADQRKIDPTDTAFSRVKDGVEKQIVWPSREWIKKWG